MSRTSIVGSSRPHDTMICVDMGTTNTRVWLVAENQIIARQTASVGVRDSARTGSTQIVSATLKDLIHFLQIEAGELGAAPKFILGAGMITSSLGLFEIPHVAAPAGDQELACSMQKLVRNEISELPIWLVPGVRTGPIQPSIDDLGDLDLIRGEETLCVGLHQLGNLGPHSTLLNLGSHWKAITLDSAGRVASSFTTLSGELIQAVQQHTVLSSSLPQARLSEIDFHWLGQGHAQQKAYGLSRSLFSVRILHQTFGLNPLQLSSFLVGAVAGADLDATLKNRKLGEHVVITGLGTVAEAWRYLLEGQSRSVSVCDAQNVEASFIAGLLHLADLAGIRSR